MVDKAMVDISVCQMYIDKAFFSSFKEKLTIDYCEKL